MENTTHFDTEQGIELLVQAFIAKELPSSSWTHQAHLVAGLWHQFHHTHEESVCLMRSRIITYNEATGGENTPSRGYHETITLFWLWVIRCYLDHHKGTLAELAGHFLYSKYADSQLPFKFYSREHLLSTRGRALWVEPDIQALDFNII